MWDLRVRLCMCLVKDVLLGPLSGQIFRRGVHCLAQWLTETRTWGLSLSSLWCDLLTESSRQLVEGPWQWTVSSEGANLLLPVEAVSGASSSLGKPARGTQVQDLAVKLSSRHRSGGGS